MRLQKRNAFGHAQASVDRNQRELEDFSRGCEKCVGWIAVRKMNLAHGENDFCGQGRLYGRELCERLRNPLLEADLQIDSAFFDEDHAFPDADR